MKDVYAILLAGGKGTRLWPLSTEECTKSFMRFGKSRLLIEDSVKRARAITGNENILIVTDRAKAPLSGRIKNLGRKNIIVEPFGRNTASAIGLAAINLRPESIMAVFPTDNLVVDTDKFRKAIEEGINFLRSRSEALLCVGTIPRYLSGSFGYIKLADNIKGQVFSIDRFIEKPSIDKAKTFLKNPNFLWNAGIFIFRAGTILAAMGKYAPLLYMNLMRIKKNKSSIDSAYSEMKNISIDYQIMEKAKNLYCVKGNFTWHDIGNWSSLGRFFKMDKNKNICIGKVKLIDVYDSLVYNTEKKPIGAIGLKGVIIVNTDKGALVCGKKDAERVKELVKKI